MVDAFTTQQDHGIPEPTITIHNTGLYTFSISSSGNTNTSGTTII